MIIVHLSYHNLSDLKIDGVKLSFPETGMHPTTHSQLVDSILEIQQGQDVHLITWSGGLFWGLAEKIALCQLERKSLWVHYHTGRSYDGQSIVEKFNLNSLLEMPVSVPTNLLYGGEIERYRVYQILERYQGDLYLKTILSQLELKITCLKEKKNNGT